MKTSLLTAFCLYACFTQAQTDSIKAVNEDIYFQNELNAEYKNREKSPLEPDDFKKFKAHSFFPIELRYRVKAKLNRKENSTFFPMKTYGSPLPNYRVFAIVEFKLEGKNFAVPVYQSQDLMTNPEYADYLFFPFTDLTSGVETYGGGRYIGLHIPKGDELIIDFNQAYNPYCAYSHGYSCPIVPTENNLDVAIRAGVKYVDKK